MLHFTFLQIRLINSAIKLIDSVRERLIFLSSIGGVLNGGW